MSEQSSSPPLGPVSAVLSEGLDGRSGLKLISGCPKISAEDEYGAEMRERAVIAFAGSLELVGSLRLERRNTHSHASV